jgi:hypothetical protein
MEIGRREARLLFLVTIKPSQSGSVWQQKVLVSCTLMDYGRSSSRLGQISRVVDGNVVAGQRWSCQDLELIWD